MADRNPAIEEARRRGETYRFLASIYLKPPTPRLIEELGRLGITGEEDLDSVTREFHNLFIVPLGQYTTPYEAVYRDEREIAGEKVRGLLMGPSTLDAIRRYRQSGAEIDQTIRELPDHVGVELGFMAFLCERETGAWEKGDETLTQTLLTRELEFLRDHLIPWVPLLAEKIRQKARLGFYRRLAILTEETVREDSHVVERSLKPCKHSSTES